MGSTRTPFWAGGSGRTDAEEIVVRGRERKGALWDLKVNVTGTISKALKTLVESAAR